MECVKSGMGREIAHGIIKKYSTTTMPSKFFAALSSEKKFPLSLDQLNNLISSPAEFAGLTLMQTSFVKELIIGRIKNKISKVELIDLR
jgi:adenylosuccinate lyase